MTNDLELLEMSLAVEDVAASARFYDALFGAALEPFEAYGATFFRGSLHGVRFVLAPNAVAGVEAPQNRHQFVYRTTDLAALATKVEAAGGTVRDMTDTAATVLDPDGNTIVFSAA